MRLHSNFRDYYDSAIGFGIDENVHYERVTKDVDIRMRPPVDWPKIPDVGLLGFCGQVFPFIRLLKYSDFIKEGNRWRREVVDSFFAYSYDSLMEKRAEWTTDNSHTYFNNSDKVNFRRFFVDWSFQSNEVFTQYKAPIWVFRFRSAWDKTSGAINPRLQDFQFIQIKDAVSAFQDISMYLSNILVEQKEIATIEDKYRIQQHGFDLKESFRNTKKRKQEQD